MRHAASAPAAIDTDTLAVGTLVVLAGRNGVWRVERVVDDEHRRCFSYVDGDIVVAPLSEIAPCPPNTRAD